MEEATFPVLVSETSDVLGLTLYPDAETLSCFLDEFADVLEEFAAWDAAAYAVDLPATRIAGLVRKERTAIRLSSTPDQMRAAEAIQKYLDHTTDEERRRHFGDAEELADLLRAWS